MRVKVLLTGNDLQLEEFDAVARGKAGVALAEEARRRVEASRMVIEQCVASDAAVYGVNTGFGRMASKRISREEIRELQTNLVRSHACGIGPPLSEYETRGMLLLRANALAKGYSGVRPIVIETLCALLEEHVHPVIPSQGSVGASGDLAPLAHLAEVAIGEGMAIFHGKRMSGGEALQLCGIRPLRLEAKEGLALLNGTQAMQSVLARAVLDAEVLLDTADVAAALSLDALRGSTTPFDEKIALVRPFAGHATSARNLRQLNEGSAIRESHRSVTADPRVQDPYCLRCVPQVHGAVRDALRHVKAILALELNSATDNPLVFAESGEVLSGGNFHGQPLAMAADHLAVALATLAGISERRTEQMTNPQASQLPAFLVSKAGLHSGFMILHVAAAALVSETKAMAAPHSVDSIPTSANQEDYVSMGMGAARRLGPMVENVRNVLAIELLAAAQGLDFLAPLRTGKRAVGAQELVRSASPFVEADRSLSVDIQDVSNLIASGRFRSFLPAESR
jgi:histidine ammonia-lyase